MANAIPARTEPKEAPAKAPKADPKVTPAVAPEVADHGVKLGNHEAFRKDN